MRKFGIELELTAPNGTNVVDLLTGLGLSAVRANYSGRNYRIFQVKNDGSIRATSGTYGIEVVSPVMAAREASYDTLRTMCRTLDDAGCKVNSSTGFHCHISLADLTPTERTGVMLRFGHMQDQIDAFMPRSRRAGMNHYVAPFSAAYLDAMANAMSRGSFFQPSGRYYNVNPSYAFQSRATIEFRQAAGTVNGDKVVGWVKFLQETIDEVVRRMRAATYTASGNAPTVPTPVSSTPVLRVGSVAAKLVARITQYGVLTQSWMNSEGIRESILRAAVHSLRQRGARIETATRGSVDIMYRTSDGQPCTVAALFASPVAAAAAPAPTGPVTPRELVNYDLFTGLSAETAAWVRQRQAVFAEDVA